MGIQNLAPRPLAIDLFSGGGGMSLGLEAAGFDIAASVEIDPIHSLIHHFNFPYGATICRDITQLSSTELLDIIRNQGFERNIDLIAGGPPCQGYSYMGRRELNDPRNRLIFEYARIVAEIQPRYFIFENVPGIAAGQHQGFLTQLIAIFEANNYLVLPQIQVLDSAFYGAPQKRKRLILLGHRQDQIPPQYPSATHGPGKLPFTTVQDAIADLSTIPIYLNQDQGIKAELLDYLGFRSSFAAQQPQGAYQLCHKRTTPTVWGHLGSRHTAQTIKRFQNTEPGTKEPISHFLRLDPQGLSNTLRAGTASNKGAFTAPRPIHYLHPRCLSIREAARLHTFPDWFQFHRKIWHGFREIGNAVVPLLAKSLGQEVIKCLGINPHTLEIRELTPVKEEILHYKMKQAAEFWQVSQDVIPKRQRIKV